MQSLRSVFNDIRTYPQVLLQLFPIIFFLRYSYYTYMQYIRTVALMLQCCVCRLSSVTLCIVAKRCILEQSFY